MSQSTVTEKRTVISSSSSGGYETLDDIPYKSNLGSRSNIISRSSLPLHSSGGTQLVRTMEYNYGSSMAGMGPGGFSSNTGVTTVKSSREKEKKDLRDLNERFANYIEKVRFLEAQNRKLGSELDELRSKWGKETSHIKQMYEAELTEARRLIDDLSKDKAALEIKSSSIVEQNADLQRQLDEAKKYRQQDREQINKLNQQVSECESEINMLRRSIESLETERTRDKGTINRLQQEVDKLRIDLNNETLAHLDAENRRQTLEEEMEFMKKVHEQELKELAALAYRDTTAENREFWKSELAQAIRDIQNEYDAKVDQLRGDMEAFYNLKIQEYRTGATKQNMEVTHIREENKKLVKQMSDLRGKLADMEARNAQMEKQYQDVLRELESKDTDHMMETTQFREEISKLRSEMEGILTELQTLMDAKLSLELEIAAYRKLLEGEENRIDWRSRATMIMYRDAFRPRSSYESSSREEIKEKPIEHKAEPVVSAKPEPYDASPDTDAASSITMSDQDMSPQGEVPETDITDLAEVEAGSSGEGQTVERSDNNVGKGKTDTTGPTSDHVVAVKEEVRRIEDMVNDIPDGTKEPEHSPKDEQPPVVEDIKPETVHKTETECQMELDEHKKSENTDIETKHTEKVHPIEPEAEIPTAQSIPDDSKVAPETAAKSNSPELEPSTTTTEIIETKQTHVDTKPESKELIQEEHETCDDKKDTPEKEVVPISVETKMSASEITAESKVVYDQVDGTNLPDEQDQIEESIISKVESFDQEQSKICDKSEVSGDMQEDKKDQSSQDSGMAITDATEEKTLQSEETVEKSQSVVTEALYEKSTETAVVEKTDKDDLDADITLKDTKLVDSTVVSTALVDSKLDSVEGKETDVEHKSVSSSETLESAIPKTDESDKEGEKQSLTENENLATVTDVGEQVAQEKTPAILSSPPMQNDDKHEILHEDNKSDKVTAKQDLSTSFTEQEALTNDALPDKAESDTEKTEAKETEPSSVPVTKASDTSAKNENSQDVEVPAGKSISTDSENLQNEEKEITKQKQDAKSQDSLVPESKDETEKESTVQVIIGKDEQTLTETKSETETFEATTASASTVEQEKPSSITPVLSAKETTIEKEMEKVGTDNALPKESDEIKLDHLSEDYTKKNGSDSVPEKINDDFQTEKVKSPSSPINTEIAHPIKKPTSLSPETMGNTEDKVLETVVASKIIEKSPQEQSLIVEASPTKELPEPFPDNETKNGNITAHTETSKDEKPTETEKSELSKPTEAIEDDKTPDDDNQNDSNVASMQDSHKHEGDDKSDKTETERGGLVTSEQEAVPLTQPKQTLEQSNQDIVHSLEGTGAAQHVEQTSHAESDTVSKEETATEKDKSAEADSKYSTKEDISSKQTHAINADDAAKQEHVRELATRDTTLTEQTSKREISMEQATVQTELKESTKYESNVEQTKLTVSDSKGSVDQMPKTESESSSVASADVNGKQTTDGTSISKEHMKQISTTESESNSVASTGVTVEQVSSVKQTTDNTSISKKEEEVKQISKAESESSSVASIDVTVEQVSSVVQKTDSTSITKDTAVHQISTTESESGSATSADIAVEQVSSVMQTADSTSVSKETAVKQISTAHSETRSETSADLTVKEISSLEQTKSVEDSPPTDVVTQDNKHDEKITKPSPVSSKSPDLVDKESVVISKESRLTESSDQSHISKTVSETNQIVNGHAQDESSTHDSRIHKTETDSDVVQKESLGSTELPEPKTDTTTDEKQPSVNGEDEKTLKPQVQTQDGLTEKIEKLLLNGEETQETTKEQTDKKDSQVSMKMMRGEVSAKTTYQRTSTGPIAISEVAADGKYIVLENTSSGPKRQDVNLDGWKLRRTVDGQREHTYNFRNFTLKAGKCVKILARGASSEAGLNDLVFRDEESWGTGSQVKTSLINDRSEEKASHVQKTLYN